MLSGGTQESASTSNSVQNTFWEVTWEEQIKRIPRAPFEFPGGYLLPLPHPRPLEVDVIRLMDKLSDHAPQIPDPLRRVPYNNENEAVWFWQIYRHSSQFLTANSRCTRPDNNIRTAGGRLSGCLFDSTPPSPMGNVGLALAHGVVRPLGRTTLLFQLFELCSCSFALR